MSRLKLVLLVAIVILLAIVFIQNREPIALKLLCPDSTQTCLYLTPSLPLAVWMGVFALGGFISSLLGQVLSRYQYANPRKYQSSSNDFEGEKTSNRVAKSKIDPDNSAIADKYRSSSYEVPQKPESVERSGSTYSYKYRDARDEPQDTTPSYKSNNQSTNSSTNTSMDSEIDLSKDDEDWI